MLQLKIYRPPRLQTHLISCDFHRFFLPNEISLVKLGRKFHPGNPGRSGSKAEYLVGIVAGSSATVAVQQDHIQMIFANDFRNTYHDYLCVYIYIFIYLYIYIIMYNTYLFGSNPWVSDKPMKLYL